MIRFDVRWQNFRGFRDTGWLPIRPITILIGANNTGKSSLIAPLLLLKQTWDSRSRAPALVTRGEFANVGSFRDLVYRHEVEREVGFALRWHSHEPDGSEEPVGSYEPGELHIRFGLRDGEIALTHFQVFDLYKRPYLTRSLMSSGRYSLRDLTTRTPPDASQLMRRADRAARNERPVNFLFDGSAVLSAQLESQRRHSDDEAETGAPVPAFEFSPFAREYWQVAAYVQVLITELLRELSYLGPLREPLRRVYELSGDPPLNVGTRGQFAPEILARRPALLDDTRTWLRIFGLGRSLRVSTGRDDAFSLYFPAGGGRPSVNLADVGFGASQILPMIVQGLYSRPGYVLAMEQPEIHLNPRLQSRIAEFLAYMARAEKGVFVETHSEHLVLRLRTLIAQEEVNPEDVALYFVNRSKSSSTITPVPISDNGFIKPTDWPRGFFHDSAREAFALAVAQDQRQQNAG